ncbi:MAG: transposase, partial [Chloroflexi bacterium]|nr:transposase [Chloroflexota bacterium]
DDLVDELQPAYVKAERKRLRRPTRQRAIGAGRRYELSFVNQLLLTIIWLRVYPTHETLGYLFEISDSTARRAIMALLPLLEQSGRDTMRMPDPGKHKRRDLDALLKDLPELMVVIDTFEQRVQRPSAPEAADRYYSGKKKQHTLKSQVAVNEQTGEFVDISESVYGPTADIKLLEQSGLMSRLPAGVGGMGDLAYVGIDKLDPHHCGAAPRRKPRGQPRPPEDIAYNTAFACRRIVVEHSLNRMRRYQALTQTDRNHRLVHEERVVAVAGLVNRQLRQRCLT